MSTTLPRTLCRHFVSVLVVAGALACFEARALAQQLTLTIRVDPNAGRVVVSGRGAASAAWSFRDSYAGILGLGNRIEQFALYDEAGKEISTRKLAPGQFEAAKPASHFRYEVNLQPPLRALDSAKVSWLTSERGVLMLADLLPLLYGTSGAKDAVNVVSATVQLQLPDSWRAYSSEKEKSASEFEVADASQAIFAIGLRLRASQVTESGMTLTLVADGEWAFADRDALEMAGKVLKAEREVFAAMPARQGTLILYPFPRTAAASEWSAETRGSTVTLLMGRLPSKVGALAQLSTPLTHELFHLWVPNGLALTGDYDWFYEGFTMYQAARTAVRLELLTFPEFLNAIGRAYDGYLADKDRDRWSLVDASRRRWTSGAPSVYSKSMLVAFILDLKIRSQSRGKRSLDDVFQRLFKQNGFAPARSAIATTRILDGNEAVLNAFGIEPAAREVARILTQEPASIDLQKELAPNGLIVEKLGLRTRLGVVDKLNKHQRDLLRDLGYNDVVRSPRR